MGTKLIIKGADFSQSGIKQSFIKSDMTQYISNGNRVRMILYLPSPAYSITTYSSAGAGVSVTLYATFEQAQIADIDGIETYTDYSYTKSTVTTTNSASGYLCVSLKKADSSAMTAREIAELVDALSFFAGI